MKTIESRVAAIEKLVDGTVRECCQGAADSRISSAPPRPPKLCHICGREIPRFTVIDPYQTEVQPK